MPLLILLAWRRTRHVTGVNCDLGSAKSDPCDT